MEKLRDLIIAIVVILVINIILYTIISYLSLEFNPLLWDLNARKTVIFVNGLTVVSLIGTKLLDS